MNVFKINKQKQVAMNEEQMKILKTGKKKKTPKNTETIFRWCISQGPARERKKSL